MNVIVHVNLYATGNPVELNTRNFWTNLFDPEMGSLQILKLRVKVDLGVIAMKGFVFFDFMVYETLLVILCQIHFYTNR